MIEQSIVDHKEENAPIQQQSDTVKKSPTPSPWNKLDMSATYDDSKEFRKLPIELKKSHQAPELSPRSQSENRQSPRSPRSPRVPMQHKKTDNNVVKEATIENHKEEQSEKVVDQIEEVPKNEPKKPVNSAWGGLTIDHPYDDSKGAKLISPELRKAHSTQPQSPRSQSASTDRKDRKGVRCNPVEPQKQPEVEIRKEEPVTPSPNEGDSTTIEDNTNENNDIHSESNDNQSIVRKTVAPAWANLNLNSNQTEKTKSQITEPKNQFTNIVNEVHDVIDTLQHNEHLNDKAEIPPQVEQIGPQNEQIDQKQNDVAVPQTVSPMKGRRVASPSTKGQNFARASKNTLKRKDPITQVPISPKSI